MPDISNWTELMPSDTSQVGKAPPLLQARWQEIGTGLGFELYWPSSGGGSELSQGELKPGASKTFYAAASASSNSADGTLRGRAFLASDTSRLYVYESNGTYLVGTPRFIERSNDAYSQYAQPGGVWVVQKGSYTTTQVNNSGSTTIDVAFSVVYSSDATVTVYQTTSNQSYTVCTDWPSVVTTGGFRSRISYLGADAIGETTIYWEAYGVVQGTGV